MKTGAIVGVTVQGADQGNTTTIAETVTAVAEELEAVATVTEGATAVIEEVVADKGSKQSGPGHIPAAARRAVWRRDGGRCAFVGTEGRCGERAFLELHHVEPCAVAGAATVENIELRCRAHNPYEARLFFGPDVVREERAWWG